MWDPPKTSKEFKIGKADFFRWYQGTMTPFALRNLVGGDRPMTQHSVGSVFIQERNGHLLVINIDAGRHNVSEYGCWSRLRFHHERVRSTERNYYTQLDFLGSMEVAAAPLTDHCTPQLLPRRYDDPNQRKRTHAGLIGKLPLLIAIAAFSAPRASLADVLRDCIQPGRWQRHDLDSGRGECAYVASYQTWLIFQTRNIAA